MRHLVPLLHIVSSCFTSQGQLLLLDVRHPCSHTAHTLGSEAFVHFQDLSFISLSVFLQLFPSYLKHLVKVQIFPLRANLALRFHNPLVYFLDDLLLLLLPFLPLGWGNVVSESHTFWDQCVF